jgi:hypothetical protein
MEWGVQNKAQEKLIGPKREEVTKGCTGLIDELHNWHTSPNIIKKGEMVRIYRMHGQNEKCVPNMVGNPNIV